MTYAQIFNCWPKRYVKPKSNKQALQILNTAVPALRYDARASCADYFGCEPASLTQELIVKHILTVYDYDAIDIGRILLGLEAEDSKTD